MIAGPHTYYFSCNLPQNLPSSSKENKGSITYKVQLIFNRPWKFDIKHAFEFTVIQNVDLNFDPLLKIPIQQELLKTFCCFFCETKPVIITANLPFSGLIAGQTIKVTVDITNPTDIVISNVQISLIKYTSYRSTCPKDRVKLEENKRHQIITGDAFCNDTKIYDVNFTVPDTVPSSTNNTSRVLNISYEIHVKATVKGCHQSPILKFPVTIGTLPFADSQFYSRYPLISSAPSYSDSFYPTAPPPSFEDAMKMQNTQSPYHQGQSSEVNRPIGFAVF